MTPGQAGYSLIEMIVAMAIMLVVVGGIFSLTTPSQGAFRVQPAVLDMQQRMRVAVDMLQKDLLMAGAGSYSGSARRAASLPGALIDFFAPVLPYRTGLVGSDPARGVSYRSDAMTVVYVPPTASQTTISAALPPASSEIRLTALPGCPIQDPACGFAERQTIVVFDDTGARDTFVITGVQQATLRVQHRDQVRVKTYDRGAFIAQVETHTYYRDDATDQLRHYDGTRSDLPMVDDVVGLAFRYFGDPSPPLAPKPPLGTANCLYDEAGRPTRPPLTASASLVELTEDMLTDGPWCGVLGNRFDADLYRVRKVAVDLRIQASAMDLRGDDPTLFVRPGDGTVGTRLVPDYQMRFDVTPRNLNLNR